DVGRGAAPTARAGSAPACRPGSGNLPRRGQRGGRAGADRVAERYLRYGLSRPSGNLPAPGGPVLSPRNGHALTPAPPGPLPCSPKGARHERRTLLARPDCPGRLVGAIARTRGGPAAFQGREQAGGP